MNLAAFRQAIGDRRIEWRKHALQRLAERGIPQSAVLAVLFSGEQIEDYPEDAPFPSGLFLGRIANKPFHAVAAFDESNSQAHIITAYEPSLTVFEADYRTRRKP